MPSSWTGDRTTKHSAQWEGSWGRESFGRGETINNPQVFSGGRENERSLPQIYNSPVRNDSGAKSSPPQRPSQKTVSPHQSAHARVGRLQTTLSTACILITVALSRCGSLSGGVFRDFHTWQRAVCTVWTAYWTVEGWNAWSGPGVAVIWGLRIFCPVGPGVYCISTNH